MSPSAPPRRLEPALLLCLFLAAMDTTIMATLLPVIRQQLGQPELYAWLVSGFMACMALTGPLAGALADRHGVRLPLNLALLFFLAGSLLGMLTHNMLWLIVARALQGLGAGMLIVLSYAALAQLHPTQRGLAQARISMIWGAAAMLGPLAGWLISQYASWRLAFALNLPLGLLCLLALQHPALTQAARRGVRLDPAAQVGFGLLIGACMLLLSAMTHPVASWLLQLEGMLGAIGLALLIWRVRQQPESSPLPLAFLHNPNLRTSLLQVALGSVALYASITLVPLLPAFSGPQAGNHIGLLVLAGAAGMVLASARCGKRIADWGYRRPLLLGNLLLLLGIGWQAGWPASAHWMGWVLAEAMIGCGMGLVAAASVVLAQNSARPEHVARHTAAIQLARNVGAAIGLHALVALQPWLTTPVLPALAPAMLPLLGLLLFSAVLGIQLPRQYGPLAPVGNH
ncbi:MFS transporter [Leeia sp.]|uniref:MFS transporter n=1 Tax=Leeia sp. TaxID=2884678 RepID=UPI0035AF7DFF